MRLGRQGVGWKVDKRLIGGESAGAKGIGDRSEVQGVGGGTL